MSRVCLSALTTWNEHEIQIGMRDNACVEHSIEQAYAFCGILLYGLTEHVWIQIAYNTLGMNEHW